jgi:hypothetical protein
MNSHNPNIVPGYYNPQQAKTEVGDYQAFLGSDFVDPTQIPMHPGDTLRPMSPPPATQPIANDIYTTNNDFRPVDVDKLRSVEDYRQWNSAQPPPLDNLAQSYQKRVQQIYSEQNISNRPIEPICIPIVINLTVNLEVNRNGNNT